MRELLAIMSALSDANRVRLVMSLNGGELCACQLVDFIGLADSTVSKHMSILRAAGLVQSRKRGRWVYYRLANAYVSPLIRSALSLVQEHLIDDSTIQADSARMLEMINRNDDSRCQTESVTCTDNEQGNSLEAA